ncbi:hypothetical protein PCASD_01188 [Puccinia coronata f. sp. avenae]|uniref:Uncharacterized protein n=1 Tax=Puccinia coronata f. sp. avenae TaxID=200324 RepID=A0A2N5SLN8_9BASI|nr:hypothetical protein PCASD_25038 [Puccinia coronata f. sp. avenae]PLW50952.1 hypothetical protein PCASD_01188 [Puccinia coronata f. sp. avenae]
MVLSPPWRFCLVFNQATHVPSHSFIALSPEGRSGEGAEVQEPAAGRACGARLRLDGTTYPAKDGNTQRIAKLLFTAEMDTGREQQNLARKELDAAAALLEQKKRATISMLEHKRRQNVGQSDAQEGNAENRGNTPGNDNQNPIPLSDILDGMGDTPVGFRSGASDPDLAHPQPNPADTRPWRGFLPDLEVRSQSAS